MKPEPSRSTKIAWLAAVIRASGDPHGMLAPLNAFDRKGGVGTFDEALGLAGPLSLDERIARRDALLVKLYEHERFAQVKEVQRFTLPHRLWKTYFDTKWRSAASKIDGDHRPGSLDHLCWQILTEIPSVINLNDFRKKVKRRKSMERQAS